MNPWARIALGIALAIAGTLFALVELGVLLIADCGPACQARGEQLLVVALLLAGLLVAAFGVRLVVQGVRAKRTP